MMKKGLLGILVVILVLGVGQYGLAAQIELELWYGLGGTPGEALRNWWICSTPASQKSKLPPTTKETTLTHSKN